MWTVQHLWNLNKFDTNYQMNQSGDVILNFMITTFISTFHFKHWQKTAQLKKWEKNMYFICTEAKGAHLIKNKEMESIWFHQFFENLQKTGKNPSCYHTSLWFNFLCQNSPSFSRLGTFLYCPLPHFTSLLVQISYYLCKHLVYV